MGISTSLGPIRHVTVPGGRIRYHDTGSGSPVVFVHGLLVNADLWRKVVPDVAAAGHRCLTPDWPFGSHSEPMPAADLTPTGAADLIAAFLRELDLTDVTLVANDTGGAITQIMLSRDRSRVGRVVFTNCDAYEKFFPQPFTPLPRLSRVPGLLTAILQSLRFRPAQRLPLAYGLVTKQPLPHEIADSYLLPSRNSAAIRADLRRFLRDIHKRHTLAAARTFREWDLPVLLAWAPEDKVFRLDFAQRLAHDLPHATLRTIEDSLTFISEDQPELLSRLIVEFTRLHATP
ncbi:MULTISPECIES: alpha/beta fold hydrolase [Nocardia]|uniref:Alpha/beta hydrolase n=2 Tax=Nocardia TaxID=1817 RepID=A0A2T2ZEL8_9NOCA|nr:MULTISPECIES: alpha/beta hydrolase [Nocardia]MBF6242512.1 alpha/beta hydrolase [Nocardia elegans]MBF6449732.1 alpha/beta hydrolase [Nocardia elegans]PSR66212.1 alpha/beta hydrolase [Nocardia nova]